MTDTVTAAIAAVDYEAWTIDKDGYRIPQTTRDATIHRMLRLLDIQPGMSVMEIGTGSGYSGALLAEAVGDSGRVVSIDVDEDLVSRARAMHAKAGHVHVELHAGDGYVGWPQGGPFDRVVGWTTPHMLPDAWVGQTGEGSVIVTPVKVAEVAAANMVLRCTVADGQPHGGDLYPGSFIEMTPEAATEFGLPIRYVDAVHRQDDGPAWWISAERLHEQPAVAERVLSQLSQSVPEAGGFTSGTEDWYTLEGHVLAGTQSPASAGGPYGVGMGVALPNSAAIALRDGSILAAGTSEAHKELLSILEGWRADGRPGCDGLAPIISRADGGWAVRVTPHSGS